MKSRSISHQKEKELREALYSELGYTYITFVKKIIPFEIAVDILTWLETHEERFAEVVDTLDSIMETGFDVYKYTRKDPVLFYQLQDAFALDDVYRTLNLSIKKTSP